MNQAAGGSLGQCSNSGTSGTSLRNLVIPSRLHPAPSSLRLISHLPQNPGARGSAIRASRPQGLAKQQPVDQLVPGQLSMATDALMAHTMPSLFGDALTPKQMGTHGCMRFFLNQQGLKIARSVRTQDSFSAKHACVHFNPPTIALPNAC